MPRLPRTLLVLSVLAAAAGCARAQADAPGGGRPNVIVILADDQGYGDIGAHGNPWVKTPHLDRLRSESVRLENFHTDPVCTPTRAGFLTGRYAVRTGAWAVTEGRQLLRRSETTLAEIFADRGYRTGIFGKWHLGDPFPFGPQHRGFQDSVVLRGGGVGEIPDAWGNDYFDDSYWRNGRLERFSGYCTDVFFREAERFVRAGAGKPFLLYLPLNAMHSPHLVEERYAAPYRQLGLPEEQAKFFGMIANFDENLGRLLALLKAQAIERDTILVYFGDNGTSIGGRWREGGGYNAGMRGNKGTLYEGGHRQACFVRWPGTLTAGRAVRALTMHHDLLPTLMELCRVDWPATRAPRRLDGRSLAGLLRGESEAEAERCVVIDRQESQPRKGAPHVVLRGPWRLVGKELYHVEKDPGQATDLASAHPEIVARLRADYDAWWNDVSTGAETPEPFIVGAPEENPVVVTARDWHPTQGKVPWRQESLADDNRFDHGRWFVEAARAGRYEVTLARFPEQAERRMGADRARLEIAGDVHVLTVQPDATAVRFEVTLPSRRVLSCETALRDEKSGRERGAYFATFRWLGE